MIELVVSGGQTGVDQAGWRAAKGLGIPVMGWMPRGFLTEDGPRPDFAETYNAREHPSPQYPPRTRANASGASLTIWIGSGDSRGFACTSKAVREAGRKFLVVHSARDLPPEELARIIRNEGHARINVAGNRESSSPSIGQRAERYLSLAFQQCVELFKD